MGIGGVVDGNRGVLGNEPSHYVTVLTADIWDGNMVGTGV